MPTNTKTYAFGIFAGGDQYSPDIEQARWTTLDENLAAIAKLVGNGVIEGWLPGIGSSAGTVLVGAGTGIVGGFAAATTATVTLQLPNSGITTDYKIIAQADSTTASQQTVTFSYILASLATPDASVLLATATVDSTGAITSLIDARSLVGITQELMDAITNHKHSGAANAPTKIDLASEVQGLLGSENIGSIPAEKISGAIPANLVRGVSHTDLQDIGALTHDQIDDLLGTVDAASFQPIGIVSAINVLQGYTILTHALGTEVQRYLANSRCFVPGLTPNAWIDTANLTGTLDTTNLQVVGITGAALSPQQAQVLSINTANGPYGFTGPHSLETTNLEFIDHGSNVPDVTLKKLYSTTTYYENGEFYIDFNANSLVSWKNLAWTAGVLGSGTLGTGGLNITMAARIGMNRAALDKGDWVTLAASPNTTADMSAVPASRWVRIKGLLDRGVTLSSSSPVVCSVSLDYDSGTGPRCAFALYPEIDQWDEDTVGIQYLYENTEDNNALQLINGTHYVTQAVYDGPVLDGGSSLVEWGKITPSYLLPASTSISIQVRHSSSLFAGNSTAIVWKNLTWGDEIEIAEAGTVLNPTPTRVTDRYLQFRITLQQTGTSPVQYTPEIMHFGISFFQEETHAAATISSISRDTSGVMTITTSANHLFPPGLPLIIAGTSESSLNGLIIEPYEAHAATITAQTATLTAASSTGGTVTPLQVRCKEWHRSGTVENGWQQSFGSKSYQNPILDNMTDAKIQGGLVAIDRNKPAKWTSAAYKVSDSKFAGWRALILRGENLGLYTISIEISDAPDTEDTGWGVISPSTSFITFSDSNTCRINLADVSSSITKPYFRVAIALSRSVS